MATDQRTTDAPPMTERAFREFVERWPEVGYLKNARLEHVYGNARCLALTGLTQEQFRRTTAHDLFPAELAETFEAGDRAILNGAPWADVPDQLLESDGTTWWVHDVKMPVIGADGELLIGGLGLNVTSRVSAEQDLREHAAFERLINDIAADLTRADADSAPAVIERLLRAIGEHLEYERAFLFRFSESWDILEPIDVWTIEGATDDVALAGNLVDVCPWVADQLREGRVIKGGIGLELLPEEAAGLREMLLAVGINSGLAVPVTVEDRCIGMLGLDTVLQPRDHSDTVVDRLRLLASMVGATLRRVEAESELRRSLDEIGRLKQRLQEENLHLRREIAITQRADGIVGESPALKRVLVQAEQVAPSDATVLITGETGSGKEVVAHAIHGMSGRRDRAMIKVNCAALPPTLIEGELFGREKGAFTGATTRQAGRFEIADGSTIFLDEIGDVPLELQAKLLHVLQDGRFERLGSNTLIEVDVRVIAASNRDLSAAIDEGRFRRDLFYRLNVFPIEVPPLRRRREDVIPLTWAFIDEFSRTMGKKIARIHGPSAEALTGYDWPGNVRELRNVVERAMILGRDNELVIDLPEPDRPAGRGQTLEDVQRRHIVEVLRGVGWRVSGRDGAAERLGLPRSTLRARMRKLGIEPPASVRDHM